MELLKPGEKGKNLGGLYALPTVQLYINYMCSQSAMLEIYWTQPSRKLSMLPKFHNDHTTAI